MNLNRAWVAITIVTIIVLDILYNMNLSYVSSALPVFIFTLYTLNKEGNTKQTTKEGENKDKDDENTEDKKNEKGKKSCNYCMKAIRNCICAFGNWE